MRRAARTALRDGLERILADGAASSGHQAAHALLDLDRFNEVAARFQMHRYASLGDTGRALNVNAALRTHLEEVCDAEPADPTLRLIAEIRSGALSSLTAASPRTAPIG